MSEPLDIIRRARERLEHAEGHEFEEAISETLRILREGEPATEPVVRDVRSELIVAGWEYEEESARYAPWRLPGVTRRVTEDAARRILDGEKCPAFLCHGPGHQSMSDCERTGEHDIHHTHYMGQRARWRQGAYTASLREKGIEFDPRSYPEGIGMTGYFDEPPEEA